MRTLLLVTITLLTIGFLTGQRRPDRPHPHPHPSPSPTTTPTPTPTPTPIQGDAWTTYGHDEHRTSQSQGSITGLVQQWRYHPPDTPYAVQRAIATSQSIYLRWQAQGGGIIVEQLSPTATRTGIIGGGPDYDRHHWPSLDQTGLIFAADDGIFSTTKFLGIDTWGDTLIADGRYLVASTHHHDLNSSLPQLYVGAYDRSLNLLWKANQNPQQSGGQGQTDMVDGLAYNSGNLFYAATYLNGTQTNFPLQDGVYSFNAATGTRNWLQPATPTSKLSADSSKVYLLEGFTTRTGTFNLALTATSLVARDQQSGAQVWSIPISFPSGGTHCQAPVLANGLAIIATDTGVEAFNATTGARVWVTAISAKASQQRGSGYAECEETTLVASPTTLVVTATDGIHLLSLIDGSELLFSPILASNPVIVGNRVYVVSQGDLLALE